MRNIGLDLLKVFSCVGVIALHSSITGFTLDNFNISAYIYYLGTYSIPLFFMVNGYFLLNKRDLSMNYIRNKIIAILYVVLFWNILIWILKGDFYSNPIRKTLGSLLQRGYFYQFWFFGSLILIYLLLPIIRKILKKNNGYIILLLVLTIIGIFIEIINTFILYKPLQQYIPQTFRIWTWLFYYIMGGFLGEINIRKIEVNNIFKGVIILLLFISPLILFYISRNIYHNIYAEYFYDSILIKVLSIGLFIMFVKKGEEYGFKYSKLVTEISALTMGVFIIHTYILELVWKYVDNKIWYNAVISFILTLSLSFITSKLIWKMKQIRIFLRI